MHVMKSRRFTRLSPREAQCPLTRRQDSTSEISSFLSRDGAAQGISAIDINAGQAQKLTRQDRSDGFLPVMPAAGMQPRLSRQSNAGELVLRRIDEHQRITSAVQI
jgi:hypothetical protein